MMTFKQFAGKLETIPAGTYWYLAELEQKCAHASRNMVCRGLLNLQKVGKVECLGHGPGASWRIKRG